MPSFRSYGPGKYDTVLDAYLDQAFEPDEEHGSVSDLGVHVSLVRTPGGHVPDEAEKLEWGPFTRAELSLMRRMKGFIRREDDQGFVDIEIYTNARRLESDWKKLVAEIERMWTESEMEEDEEYY